MTKKITKFAIIVAGGVGSRMQSKLPKQYLLLDGIPVLMYSIRAFHEYAPNIHIIVAVSEQMLGHWQALCRQHQFDIPHEVVIGGISRIASVYNSLRHITSKYPDLYGKSLMAVHDGARPLVTVSEINRLYTKASQERCAIPAIPSTNSIRIGTEDKNKTMDRNLVWQVQTPQVFDGEVLVSSYQSITKKGNAEKYTDDASIVEEMGNTVNLVPGDYRNIKITYPEDISIALIYLKSSKQKLS